MKVVLAKNDKLLTYMLPNKVTGNIWLSEIDENGIEKNIINLEANSDGEWKIVSNSDYYIVENSKRVPFVVAKENSYYEITYAYSYDKVYLFMPSTYEKMHFYSCSTELPMGITIGSDSNCTISYNFNAIQSNAITIKQEGPNIIITNNDNQTNIFINGLKVNSGTKIEIGDVIFILGLELLLLKKDGNYVLGISNNYNNVQTFMKSVEMQQDLSQNRIDEPQEEKDMELYSKEDYFYRKPRFIYSINSISIRVDNPPGGGDKNEMPAILTIGPMLTMSMTSVMTFYTTMNNVNNGNQTMNNAIPSLVMSGAMMLSFLMWPLLTNRFQKRLEKKKEKERKKKYSAYIDSIKKQIENEKQNQQEIMHKRFLNLSECEKVILNREDRLWERRIEDDDFLSVSLGSGKLPLDINVVYPEEHFSMTEDVLLDKVKELKSSKTLLENVPIPFSFRENYISAIIGDKIYQNRIIKNILLQLSTFHSYDDLKFVIFTTEENKNNYEEVRSIPHLWSNDKSVRYFSSNEKEYKEVSYQLDKIYNKRMDALNNSMSGIENFDSLYVLIIDSINSVRNIDLINNIINNKNYVGFSVIILNDRISNLPDQCQTFIEVSKEKSTISRNISNSLVQEFSLDLSDCNFPKCFKTLSNIPIEIKDEGEGIIPKRLGFLEMYNIGKIESFNSKQRWIDNVPILSMSVPVGVGKNGEKISLDLHEKYHGPHGLIAGMTGSGKSEFIITYILSLAVNYHPDEVQFILIDYKGGGLAGAFENQNLGIKLPHLVGTITNLDKNEINRSLASIESELKRRQALFNKAREISEESTVDIYKYQEMYRNHVVDEPVSHLLIIADEFAELKNQQPEFMDQLISTARIGRSLGVHLILATQKPSGVVDSQIWSNTRFRVCLRVQDKSDSSEVIKQPDAAFLTQTGRFYLQVGFNEIFVLGQSAYTGTKYIPTDALKRQSDTSIDFINNMGYKIRTVQTRVEQKSTANYGEELINIVKYLSNIAKEENIVTRPLWLSKIPECIFVDNLIKKYNYVKKNYVLNPVVGEYDVPANQEQRLLTINLTEKGNSIIYGSAGSGKENFITTMIYSSMVAYTPNEVNYYVVDFGSESLRCFNNSPYVGDIMYPNDDEKIENLYKMIQTEIDERKSLFSNYNGNYVSYCKDSGNIIPNLVIIINNYEAYIENFQSHEDILNILTRDCTKYGIFFVLAVNTVNGVRFKLKQNFGQVFTLQLNSEDDYSTVLGNVHKTYPSKLFGRGLIKEDDIYEFQTALASEKSEIPNYIKDYCNKNKEKYNYIARRVPILPEIVSYDDCRSAVENNNLLALGINKLDLLVATYDFTKDVVNIMTSQDITLLEGISTPFIEQCINKKSLTNIIINAENFALNDKIKSYSNYFEGNFNNVFDAIKKYINDSLELYNSNNGNKNVFDGKNKVNCVIIGISSFINKISPDRKNEMNTLFANLADLGVINFVIIDTLDKIKKFTYDSWFKDNYNSSNGIYLGNGLGEQILINTSKRVPEMKEDVPYNFGFVIRRGIPTYVKFIEQI